MVTVDEAKAHLKVTDGAEDAVIDRLVQAATEFLTRIGVETADPMPRPVEQACLMLVRDFYEPIARDPALRGEAVEGIGSVSYHLPEQVGEARMRTINALIAPYRDWPV